VFECERIKRRDKIKSMEMSIIVVEKYNTKEYG
jgi:hypothetical protein